MQNYEIAIKVAVLTFPIIAFLITLPYMLQQYHKYGSIPFFRTVVIYSFVLYLLTAYFLVILPLPTIEEVSHYTGSWVQLTPFNFLKDISMNSKLVLSDIHTYLPALNRPVVYINLFNWALTVPFGVYLRYYFKKNWKEVIAYSFLLSLFFELTQLTGLYGIYPRPYRLFDVDDLIINTFGGLTGYFITPLLSHFLPSREKLDEVAYERGRRVTYLRRFLAFFVDFAIFNVIILFTLPFVDFSEIGDFYFVLFLVYFLVSAIFMRGRTFGKMVVGLKIASEDGKKVKTYQIVIRYFFAFMIFYQVYDVIDWCRQFQFSRDFVNITAYILYIMLGLIYCKTLIDILTKKEQLFYETISNTKNVSVIQGTNQEPEEDMDEEEIERTEEIESL